MMVYFRYHNTNCFFLRSALDGALLAVDAGWPCTLFEYARMMKEIGCRLEDVRWAMVTHFHMDHAGLIGEFLDRGIRCLIFENQHDTIDAMEATISKNYRDYRRIDQGRLEAITTAESRDYFGRIGIEGRVVVTDYHSPDSVSVITPSGDAIVGDLPPIDQLMPDDRRSRETWQIVRAAGGRTIYPSHAMPFELES